MKKTSNVFVKTITYFVLKKIKMNRIKVTVTLAIAILLGSTCYAKETTFYIEVKPQVGLMTETIQKAINSCAEKGGGTVNFSSGTYLCGGIELAFQKTKSLSYQNQLPNLLYKNQYFLLLVTDSLFQHAAAGNLLNCPLLFRPGIEFWYPAEYIFL